MMGVNYEYGNAATEELTKIFQVSRLESLKNTAEKDIEIIREYISALNTQIHVATFAELQKHISVVKVKSYTGHREYKITVTHTPYMDGEPVYRGSWSDVEIYPHTPDHHNPDQKTTGREIALARAAYLGMIYNCPVEVAFPVTKKERAEYGIGVVRQ
jgi:hypothetical protein